MIKYIFIPLCILYITAGFSQESPAITTAFPFLLISTDPIASGIGDIGVASSADAFLRSGTHLSIYLQKTHLP